MRFDFGEDAEATMEKAEIKALYYGELAPMPEMQCDGYILENGAAGISERGTAVLLDMQRQSLNTISLRGLPPKLAQFMESGEKLYTVPVKVVASNSPHVGRFITFYSVEAIELLLRVYSRALIEDVLQKNQEHIGRRAIVVQSILARSALTALIRECCGLRPNLQKTLAKEFRRSSLAEESEILQGTLKIQYPELDDKKRRALVAKGFKFGYEDALTPEEYMGIKGKGYPLHQHIESEETRKVLSQYLLMLAGQMVVKEANIVKAREDTKRLWPMMGQRPLV